MLARTATVIVALVLTATALLPAPRAAASDLTISGYVTDGLTGQPLAGVCVTLGVPGSQCFKFTDASGFYLWDIGDLGVPPGQTWDLYFIKSGYQTTYSDKFVVSGPVRFNQPIMPASARQLCPTPLSGMPTQTVYLANVTKSLGGTLGWQTPFIVQNTGTQATTLEVTFIRFLTGVCAVRRTVTNLMPGTSFADVPNSDNDLPGDTQFAVVVRSFGSTVVSVVNEHAGGGARAEAMAYSGVSSGSTSVFLPNITRRFNGFVTPFIIQNLGGADATASSRFVSFDGTAPEVTVTRSIPPGGSKFVDPNSEPGLVDGKQYSVTVTANVEIAVIVNTHNDASTVASPVAYSTNGIRSGSTAAYGPYAAKNAGAERQVTTIVVQNMSAGNVTPSLTFTPLGGGTPQTFTSPAAVPPGRAWAFDPRFTLGTTTPCTQASATCLGEGEYSFVALSNGSGEIAVAVNVISQSTAMGHMAIAQPSARVYMPNVTRRLGGSGGWTTPILLQTVNATGATLRWFRFSDGALVHTQTVAIPQGAAVRIDPRDVPALADDTQYSVVADGTGGTIAAIVMQLAFGGDNAMIYEAFPASQ